MMKSIIAVSKIRKITAETVPRSEKIDNISICISKKNSSVKKIIKKEQSLFDNPVMEALYSLLLNEETEKYHIFGAHKKGSAVETDKDSFCGKAVAKDLKSIKAGVDEKALDKALDDLDDDEICGNCLKSYEAD